jgi:hypothetical protein
LYVGFVRPADSWQLGLQEIGERLRIDRRMEELKEEIMSRQQDSAILLKTGGRQIKGQ